MAVEDTLNKLERKNNHLKSKLLHEQLKHDNYHSQQFKESMLEFISEYRQHKSFLKASLNTGVDQNIAFLWYIQGQLGNPEFRGFYLSISSMFKDKEVNFQKNDEIDEEYIISEYGDGWSYKTFINGEKIFIIANELDDLKKKVKAKNLPLD